MTQLSEAIFTDLLKHPDARLQRWIDGTVASDFLGGAVDAGKFDESDFAALHNAVREVGYKDVARFIVYCLERLHALSIEDLDAPLE